MIEHQVCGRCRFWLTARRRGPASLWSTLTGRNRRATSGRCHRHAPRASSLTPQWPKTRTDDACGEFAPRPDEQRRAAAPDR